MVRTRLRQAMSPADRRQAQELAASLRSPVKGSIHRTFAMGYIGGRLVSSDRCNFMINRSDISDNESAGLDA